MITMASTSRACSRAPGIRLRPPAERLRLRLIMSANASQNPNSNGSTIDWEARGKQKLMREILESTRKLGPKFAEDKIREGLDDMESLLPGFTPNLEHLKASDWARLALDAKAVGQKIIILKLYYPRLDLSRAIMKYPKILLKDVAELEQSAIKVKQLLERANNPEAIIQVVPELLEPKVLASVLVTINKWYQLQEDPVKVLERDPDLVLRAQAVDQPFEPVYQDENGNWSVPLLNYKEKRADWQAYIDRTRYKQP